MKAYMSNGFKGKSAAITAGYSKHTAEVQASRLLRNVKVKNAVEKSQQKVADKMDFSREHLMKLVMRQALFDGDGSTHGARVSALGLLGKWTGLDVVKLEQDTHVSFQWISEGDSAKVIDAETE